MASKKNKTFADQAKAIMSKYALRPNDNASKAAMNRELDVLKEQQEMERQKMAQEAMETLNSLGMAPQAPGMMGDQMPMQQAYGGKMCACGKPGCIGCGGKKYATGGAMNAYSDVVNTSVDTPTDPPRTSNRTSYDKSTGLWSSTNPNQANFAALQQRSNELNELFEQGTVEESDPMVQDTLRDLWRSADKNPPEAIVPEKWQKEFADSTLTYPEFISKKALETTSGLWKEDSKLKDLSDVAWSAATISNLADSLFGKRKDGKSHWGPAHYEGVKKMYDGTSNWEEPVDITNSRTKNTSPMDRELNVGDVLGRGRSNMQNANANDFRNQQNAKGKKVKYPLTHFDMIVDKGVDDKGSYYVVAGGNRKNIKEGKGETYRQNKVYYNPETFELIQKNNNSQYTIASKIKEEHNIANLPVDAMPTLSPSPLETAKGQIQEPTENQIRQTPAMMYAKMREEGFDPTALFAYGGNMKKKYVNGGFGVELNMPDIPASYGSIPKAYEIYGKPSVNKDSFDVNLEDNYFLNADNFTTQEELDFLKAYQNAGAKTKKKDKPKDPTDPEEKTFEGKLTAGDVIAGGIGAAGDIYGLAYAMKKPEPRKRMTAEEETLDTTPYDQAYARGMAAQRDIRRSNPNAALQAQIAGTTALSTGLGAAQAAAQQEMDVRNIGRRMGAEQINLGQDERDRQARDARAMAISEHLAGIGDTYTGLRKDKKTMEMEAQIANMLGTDNYTFKKNDDGTITIVPKI